MTLNAKGYWGRVMKSFHLNPSWRKGQHYFNTLYNMHPSLADEIRGTDKDPLLSVSDRDERTQKFFKYIVEISQ